MTVSTLDPKWVQRCREALTVTEKSGVPRADCLGTLRAALFIHVLRIGDDPDLVTFREQLPPSPPTLTPEERAEAEKTEIGRFLKLGVTTGTRFLADILWEEAHEAGYDDNGTLNLLWRSLDAAAAERLVNGGL